LDGGVGLVVRVLRIGAAHPRLTHHRSTGKRSPPYLTMPKILPDREIRKLLEKVIIGSSPQSIGPNSYELCLGNKVRFDSTGEELDIPEGHFVEIPPGDFVTISNLEKLDFRRDTVASFGKKSIAGLITPTTTMMCEGWSCQHF